MNHQVTKPSAAASERAREIASYRKKHPYRVDWYARNGTIRQEWFRTLREARIEASKHRDSEIFKEIH
jgi:hypothetical protein